MSEIKTIFQREVVAEIYDHEWSDDVIMAKKPKGPLTAGEQKRVSLDYVEDFVERCGYEIEFYGSSHDSMMIIDEYEKKICEKCDSKAMYDKMKDEYYCPVCCR